MNQTTSTMTLRHKSKLAQRFLDYLGTKVSYDQLKSFFITSPEVDTFQKKLEFYFTSDDLLFRSMIHSSLANESIFPKLTSNEVLEFLGDGVINLIVAEELMKRFPDQNEGVLSKLRSSIVSEEMLSDLAISANLDSIMLMGKGEIRTESHLRSGPLSDSLEALVAAAYKDQGIEGATKLFLKVVKRFEASAPSELFSLIRIDEYDAKTRLQEYSVKAIGSLPEYRAHEIESGIFEVQLFLAGELKATIRSCSKKKGEKEAAAIVLKKLKA